MNSRAKWRFSCRASRRGFRRAGILQQCCRASAGKRPAAWPRPPGPAATAAPSTRLPRHEAVDFAGRGSCQAMSALGYRRWATERGGRPKTMHSRLRPAADDRCCCPARARTVEGRELLPQCPLLPGRGSARPALPRSARLPRSAAPGRPTARRRPPEAPRPPSSLPPWQRAKPSGTFGPHRPRAPTPGRPGTSTDRGPARRWSVPARPKRPRSP